MKLIDKDKVVAEIERIMNEQQEVCKADVALDKDPDSKNIEVIYQFQQFTKFLNNLEVKEVIAEQECTCNEALNRIIGGSWNLLCPVNKLGLKTGDKVKVIIKALRGK